MTSPAHDSLQDAAAPPTVGSSGSPKRRIDLRRTDLGRYEATNERGGRLTLGIGDSDDFTPVELLLAAIAGCSAVDVDHITSRRAEPTQFDVAVTGDKLNTPERGAHMDNIRVTFTVRFPPGADGDRAREVLPRSVRQSQERLCTVSRTVEHGANIEMATAPAALD